MDEDEVANAAEQTRAIPMVTRQLEIRAGTFNEADNTVEVVWTTGARGTRFDWRRWETIEEELSTDPAHVRLDRINRGGPVLNTHSSWELEDQIGVVVPGSARMEGGLGIATLQLSRRDSVKAIVQDIRDGIIRNLSVGYQVHAYEITEKDGERPLYRAVDWEPYEISFVPMPFDAGAQVRSAETARDGNPCIMRRAGPPASTTQERTMDEDTVQAGGQSAESTNTNTESASAAGGDQQQRQETQQRQEQAAIATVGVSAIRTAVRNAGLAEDVTFELLERHEKTPLTRDALMADIGRRFAERDSQATTANRVAAQAGNGVTMARAMEDAIVHRMSPGSELSESGRNFRGMNMLRMAEELLGSSGISTRGMAPSELAERALHSGSDFPQLIGSALNRRLRQAYEENSPSYQRWARRAPNAPNFKNIDVVQMSALPDLLRVNEGGEFKYGTASDGKVSYQVVTYGRIIGLTRQLIINDDLRALERITTGFAGSASRLENRTVYSVLTSNPAMPDGTALFHANHGNLAGSGAAISATTLGAGRTRMRLQKGLQNEELNLAPAYLIVPATQEQLAYQYTSSQYVPAKQSDTNEFRAGGRTSVEPIVEAVLDGNSTTAYYLAASNSQVDTIEYCYLEGAEGVQLSSRIGFTVDGVEFKASLDFAAAAIDHRGLDKNPGA